MYQHLSLSVLSPENLEAVNIVNCIAVLSTLISFFSRLGLCLRDVLQRKKQLKKAITALMNPCSSTDGNGPWGGEEVWVWQSMKSPTSPKWDVASSPRSFDCKTKLVQPCWQVRVLQRVLTSFERCDRNVTVEIASSCSYNVGVVGEEVRTTRSTSSLNDCS